MHASSTLRTAIFLSAATLFFVRPNPEPFLLAQDVTRANAVSVSERAAEARKIRDIKLATLQTIYDRIQTLQLATVVGVAIILLLSMRAAFRRPKPVLAEERLSEWLAHNNQDPLLLSLNYTLIAAYELTETARNPLTESIVATGLADQIVPSTRMTEVAQFLGDRFYGVNFVELPDIEKALALIEEQKGAILLADLVNYHYEGGPFVQGTRLRDSFFADYGLGRHRLLAEKFPYEPNRRIVDYLKAMRDEIAQVKTKYHEAYERWMDLTTGYLQKYRISDWSWYAWCNLRDEPVASWNNLIRDSIGVVDQAVRSELGQDRSPDWGSVLRWLRSTLTDQRAKADESSAITLWSNRFVLPLGHLLLLLPLLFAGSQSMLLDLYAQRRVAQIEVARLDQYIGNLLNERIASTAADSSVLNDQSLWHALVSRDWWAIRQLDPNFASNLLLSALSWSIALWLTWRSVEIAFRRDHRLVSRYDNVIIVVVLALSAILLVFSFISGRQVVQHVLQSKITALQGQETKPVCIT